MEDDEREIAELKSAKGNTRGSRNGSIWRGLRGKKRRSTERRNEPPLVYKIYYRDTACGWSWYARVCGNASGYVHEQREPTHDVIGHWSSVRWLASALICPTPASRVVLFHPSCPSPPPTYPLAILATYRATCRNFSTFNYLPAG